MTAQLDAKKLEVIHGSESGAMGFRVQAEGLTTWVSVWFPDLDAVKGLAMLDQLRDELQAVVLDKLIEEGGQ